MIILLYVYIGVCMEKTPSPPMGVVYIISYSTKILPIISTYIKYNNHTYNANSVLSRHVLHLYYHRLLAR